VLFISSLAFVALNLFYAATMFRERNSRTDELPSKGA